MQFLEWLDRHFASNCHYYYADDLGCPLDLYPDPRLDPVVEPAGPTQTKVEETSPPDRPFWQ